MTGFSLFIMLVTQQREYYLHIHLGKKKQINTIQLTLSIV